MPYIISEYAGHKTAGSYLTIDDGLSTPKIRDEYLGNSQVLSVAAGFHQIKVSSMSAKQKKDADHFRERMRNMTDDKTYEEKYAEYGKPLESEINCTLENRDVVIVKTVSDLKGNIIEEPSFEVKHCTEEEFKHFTKMNIEDSYKDNSDNAVKTQNDSKNTGCGFGGLLLFVVCAIIVIMIFKGATGLLNVISGWF